MNLDKEKLRVVESWPKKSGKSVYLKFLEGQRLTQGQAIKAKCYDCSCGEPDECSIRHCPLLPFHRAIHTSGDAAMVCTAPGSK